MISQPKYSLAELWADLHSVNQVRKSWGLIPSFDENVKNHFESIHGVSDYTNWRYGRFMLVMIYLRTNREAFNVGNLAVSGGEIYEGVLISNKLAGIVLRYALEHPITRVLEFPVPEYFISESDRNE